MTYSNLNPVLTLVQCNFVAKLTPIGVFVDQPNSNATTRTLPGSNNGALSGLAGGVVVTDGGSSSSSSSSSDVLDPSGLGAVMRGLPSVNNVSADLPETAVEGGGGASPNASAVEGPGTGLEKSGDGHSQHLIQGSKKINIITIILEHPLLVMYYPYIYYSLLDMMLMLLLMTMMLLMVICDDDDLVVMSSGNSSSGPRGMAIVAIDNVVCVRFARPKGWVDEAAVARCPMTLITA